MKKIITILSGVLLSFTASSQDVHFTMFHVAPTVLNPASAGLFEGTFRGSSNFKTQWGSVSNPYNTLAVSIDGNAWRNSGKTAHLGMALNAYRDVAGSTNFGTTKINLSLSSILWLNDKNMASIGLTGGWGQRTISPGNLQWDAQFDGQVYDPTLPSNESYAFQNSSFIDFGLGAMWAYGTSATDIGSFDKFKAQVGIAYHHLAKPEIRSYEIIEKLYSRFVIHADMHYSQKGSKLAVRPRFSALMQGPSRELNVGCMFRYLIQEGSKYTGNNRGFAISLGGYYRIADAISPSIEIEWAGFTIGYSYDVNTSGLRAASLGRGGSEFYLKFQNPNPFFSFSRTPSIR
jgi:type IX secretion system PorP/SprF family membrane protein